MLYGTGKPMRVIAVFKSTLHLSLIHISQLTPAATDGYTPDSVSVSSPSCCLKYWLEICFLAERELSCVHFLSTITLEIWWYIWFDFRLRRLLFLLTCSSQRLFVNLFNYDHHFTFVCVDAHTSVPNENPFFFSSSTQSLVRLKFLPFRGQPLDWHLLPSLTPSTYSRSGWWAILLLLSTICTINILFSHTILRTSSLGTLSVHGRLKVLLQHHLSKASR